MGILVGTDEAGYGPNLGPLVVAATAWEVDEAGRRGQEAGSGRARRTASAPPQQASVALAPAARPNLDQADLYQLLRPTVARTPHEKRIGIADSKLLYRPGLGLRQLERGLHSVLHVMQRPAACWSEIMDLCGADVNGHHRRLCWHDGFDCRLLIDAAADELLRLGARMGRACDAGGVRPLVVRARMVFPAEFNELVEHFGTKGAALSHITVGLLREVMDGLQNGETLPAPVFAVCDKHGGRNFYTSLLQHHFSEHWIEPVFESHKDSRYAWGPEESRVSVSFRVGGERFLPTALASMTAKYLRELAMRAFNDFWRAHIPNLRPTAGYYGDSRRFKKDITAKQRELRIEDRILWRSR